MTTVSRPPAVRPPPEGWEAAPAAPDPPPPSPPSPRGSRRLTWRTAGFGTALVALTLAIPVLTYAGVRTVLDSNEGRVIDPETDPTAPGFEAVVEPTPTFLVNMVDGEGDLAGTVAISLAAEDQGGTMLFFPNVDVVQLGQILHAEHVRRGCGEERGV